MTMNEPIAAALHKRLTDQGQHLQSTVVPPDWHLSDPDLERDAVFYEKPYSL